MGDDRDSRDPGLPARKKSTTGPLAALLRLDWRWLSALCLIASAIWTLSGRARDLENQLADVDALREVVPALVVRASLLETRTGALEAAVAELKRICGGPP